MTPSIAAAEEERAQVGDAPNASYLWDGGALPFIWGALAARIALDRYVAPRESPLLFDQKEGGATRARWEIPGWGVSALSGVAVTGMIASGDDSRWFHVKGLGESLATGCLITGGIKVAFARHRPSYTEGDSSGERRSFPSGHTTQAFAISTYSILYLHDHVFAAKRAKSGMSGYEIATYAGITMIASGLAYERVAHNRHHLSDVVAGGLLGTAGSAVFYAYQERRYRRRAAGERRSSLTVAPSGSTETVGLQLGFQW